MVTNCWTTNLNWSLPLGVVRIFIDPCHNAQSLWGPNDELASMSLSLVKIQPHVSISQSTPKEFSLSTFLVNCRLISGIKLKSKCLEWIDLLKTFLIILNSDAGNSIRAVDCKQNVTTLEDCFQGINSWQRHPTHDGCHKLSKNPGPSWHQVRSFL